MKLLRYGPPGGERPGLLDSEGVIRDLSGHGLYITGDRFQPGVVNRACNELHVAGNRGRRDLAGNPRKI